MFLSYISHFPKYTSFSRSTRFHILRAMDAKYTTITILILVGLVITCVQWLAIIRTDENDFTLEYQDKTLLELNKINKKLDLFNVRLRQLQDKVVNYHSTIRECSCKNGHAEWHKSCSDEVNWCFLCDDGFYLDGKDCKRKDRNDGVMITKYDEQEN